MSGVRIGYLVILGLCALGSGFFSGSETALIGVGRERVEQLATTGKAGERVRQLVSDPDRLLSTLLVANNLVNILGASVATTLFIDLLGDRWGPWAATGAVTAVILVVGEITPKSIAARYPERFSLTVAPIIWQLSRVLGPIARLFTGITRVLFRVFRLPLDSSVGTVTDEDIRALARLGEQGGEIHAVEREIIDSLFGLADRPVREAMTPRADITYLTLPISIEDIRRAVSTTGHSRFPVTAEDDLDALVGVVYVKDVLRTEAPIDQARITRLVRTPGYVPESTTILVALQSMRRQRSTFSMVVDEHGGIEGIVTIKDLVAELVGEIQDEFDPNAPGIVRVARNEWLADGRLPVEDLAGTTGRDIPMGPFSTVAGLFMASSGRIPEEGDSMLIESVRITVLSMDRNRIDRVRIKAEAD